MPARMGTYAAPALMGYRNSDESLPDAATRWRFRRVWVRLEVEEGRRLPAVPGRRITGQRRAFVGEHRNFCSLNSAASRIIWPDNNRLRRGLSSGAGLQWCQRYGRRQI